MLSLRIVLLLIWIFVTLSDGIINPVTDDNEIMATSSGILDVVEEFYVNQNLKFYFFVFHAENRRDKNYTDDLIDDELNDLKNGQTTLNFDQIISKFLSRFSKYPYHLSTNQTTYVNG